MAIASQMRLIPTRPPAQRPGRRALRGNARHDVRRVALFDASSSAGAARLGGLVVNLPQTPQSLRRVYMLGWILELLAKKKTHTPPTELLGQILMPRSFDVQVNLAQDVFLLVELVNGQFNVDHVRSQAVMAPRRPRQTPRTWI